MPGEGPAAYLGHGTKELQEFWKRGCPCGCWWPGGATLVPDTFVYPGSSYCACGPVQLPGRQTGGEEGEEGCGFSLHSWVSGSAYRRGQTGLGAAGINSDLKKKKSGRKFKTGEDSSRPLSLRSQERGSKDLSQPALRRQGGDPLPFHSALLRCQVGDFMLIRQPLLPRTL